MRIKSIEKLLAVVLSIKKKNDAVLDATGGRFNIFQTLGVNHYENKHSLILAALLNPGGTHGLKDEFLNLFVKMIAQKNSSLDFDCSNVTVITEHVITDGRLDIIIKNPEQAIIIENKIYARDQSEQLIRYNNYAEQKYDIGKYIILYLTLWGNEASKQSSGATEYICLSYENDIIEWLEECLKISLRHPTVRETLVQYINHLKQLTNQDMESKNSEEIVKALADNVESSIIVYQNFNNMKSMLIEEMVKRVSEKFDLNYSLKNENSFHFYKNDWPTGAGIYFAENNKQLYFAFKNQAASVGKAEPQYLIKELFDIDPIPFDQYGYKLIAPHWNFDNEILIDISNGKFEKEIVIKYLGSAE